MTEKFSWSKWKTFCTIRNTLFWKSCCQTQLQKVQKRPQICSLILDLKTPLMKSDADISIWNPGSPARWAMNIHFPFGFKTRWQNGQQKENEQEMQLYSSVLLHGVQQSIFLYSSCWANVRVVLLKVRNWPHTQYKSCICCPETSVLSLRTGGRHTFLSSAHGLFALNGERRIPQCHKPQWQ